ncbi:class I SAM-dependent methyltransferase [Tahibacter soli]|uniref:SAM-dependent methyltransferase n=1 Tax=Tahibacter soli TaxID=2983605 RepID=A0A9X3YL04_9GAMM|nr:SAM-dependent methyltransferase [Tahibacter soli]MDC8013175.1 SAM-dependent methyltransferase [Tahibacter soli]
MRIDLPEPTAAEREHSDTLARFIRNEIAEKGPMPFSRFMELALYAPGLGYYSAGKTKFGAAGDFITAPELGSVFARCVARAVAPALRDIGADAAMLELGGGSGAFAEHCLAELQRLDAVPATYSILEPSADLRERQRERVRTALPPDLAARVRWIDRPPEDDWRGVLFANEVIDALPTTRFSIRGGEVFEEHIVDDGDGGFAIVDLPADGFVGGAVRHIERDIEQQLPDDYRSEVLPQLPYWIQAVCGGLAEGLAIFVDYGYARREYYRADRRDGTLLANYRHRAHDDPFRLVGLQDITAFVDFGALAEAGKGAGFDIAGLGTQADFLIANGLADVFADLQANADEVERYRVSQEIKRLTLPGEMGEKFKVIAFSR